MRGERTPQRRTAADGSGGRPRGRPGDWQCSHCQAFPCFGRTVVCYRCGSRRRDQADVTPSGRSGADRGLAAATERDRHLGPVGANGARPLLGGRGTTRARTDDQRRRSPAPSYRVPGASQAARAEAEARRGGGNEGGGGRRTDDDAAGAAAAAGPQTDGDFRPVHRGAPMSIGAGTAIGGRTFASSNSWAELAEEEDAMDQEEGGGVEGVGGDDDGIPREPGSERYDMDDARRDGDGGDADGGIGAPEGDDEHSLRLQWDEHVRACKRLERDPSMPPAIVAKAKALRDEAEQRWRAARTPHSLSKRMRWAGADLRSAEEKEQTQRRELQAHLDETSRRTKELEARVQVAAARTARKRSALQALLAEGVPGDAPPQSKWPMALAATAVTGISESIAPPLAAAIERLSMPMGSEDAEGVRQELQLAAASLGTLEQMLRGQLAPTAPPGTAAAHFDISGDAAGDGASDEANGSQDGGGGKRRALDAGETGAAVAARWTRAASGASWVRKDSSIAAVEAARRIIVTRTHGAAAARCPTGQQEQPAGASSPTDGGPAGGSMATAAAATDPAATNDLALAERRAREAAEMQMRQVLQQQQAQRTVEQQQLEEQQRAQRLQRQQEEQQRHMLAVEQAAATRAAEEAKQREEAFARLSPEERDRARALHAQHEAVGAQAFGTLAASHLAGLVHRTHVQNVIRGAAGAAEGNADENVDFLMSLSPEQFAEYEHQQMGRGSPP